ncbi:Ger(x)C family germination protein [Gracilibacillus halotolerans]|uniref:Ger(X)C family germination protein n=1 Tax=Gracilibacillus halotolerans TaxID=74386 RepID=A0A841RQM6_9BACI|nr:Ger(x)C family spore germination protein [Gracilibacillus halotolerans]MBB6513505.1 Ger(x)C family germination protein [Gracilibacillus halotolerans]
MKKITFLALFIVFLTGCWDQYELEDRANILGIAIDVADEEDMEDVTPVTHKKGEFPDTDEKELIKVTAQIALPGKIKLGPEGGEGESSSKNAWTIETVGYTVNDTMANLQQQLAERLYLGHVQIIIISEEIAKKDLSEINDFFRRNPEVRRTSWMVVNEGDAKKVLEASPPVETVPSLYLSETLNNAVRFGKLPPEYLGKFWIDLTTDGIDAALPSVKVKDNDRILVDGMSYFHGNSMAGKFSPVEVGIYMSMKDRSPGGYTYAVKLPDEEGVYMVKPESKKGGISVKVVDGKPIAELHMEVNAAIEEETKVKNLDKHKVEDVEKEAEKKAKDLGEQLIKKLQDEESDIFGLGAKIRSKHRNYWNEQIQTIEKWREVYKDMDITVDFTVNIKRTGMEWE